MSISSTSNAQDKKFWIALAHCEAITPAYWKLLLSAFGSAEIIWHAEQQALERAGITARAAEELIALRGTLDIDTKMTAMEKEDIVAVTINEPTYPTLLKEIADPPHVLFVQGTLKAEEPVGTLGVVGTRKISPYGQSVLPPIIRECVGARLTIVSGLAIGIDTCAHTTTIEQGGRTIAVIGSGIDRASIYPWQNVRLADAIVAYGGAIVSEYPPGTKPMAHHFPARNRIISGCSLGTLVCEAPKKSGALITAYAALDQNRDVFVIPGAINHPNSWGPNDLLKRGAIPVTSAEDILHALPITPTQLPLPIASPAGNAPTTVSPTEAIILALLTNGTLHIDTIVEQSHLTTDVIMSTLVLMEMGGKVRNVGGMQYTIN